MSLPQRITSLRTRAQFSIPTLARRCGIDRSLFWRYEQGEVAPTTPTLERIAAALGLSMAEFWSASLHASKPRTVRVGREVPKRRRNMRAAPIPPGNSAGGRR